MVAASLVALALGLGFGIADPGLPALADEPGRPAAVVALEAELDAVERGASDAQVSVQLAAEDYDVAAAALADARSAAAAASARSAAAAAKLKTARVRLGAVYRAGTQGENGLDLLGRLVDSGGVQAAASAARVRHAVERKAGNAVTVAADAGAAAEAAKAKADAAAARAQRAADEAGQAFERASRAARDLAGIERSAAERRAALFVRLAAARGTSVAVERARWAERMAAAADARETAARAAAGLGAVAGAGSRAGAGAGTGSAATTPKATSSTAVTSTPKATTSAGPTTPTAPRPKATATATATPKPAPSSSSRPPKPAPSTTKPSTPKPSTPKPSTPKPSTPKPTSPVPPASPPGSWNSTAAQGVKAAAWAKSKVGAAYQLGGTGPAFDCSGLTSAAWGSVGLSITRTSRSQYHAAARIAYSQLRAGDLIFYATDRTNSATIYHVAMYLGKGQMVEARYPGATAWVTSLRLTASMPYAGRP